MKQWYVRVMGVLSVSLLGYALVLRMMTIQDGYMQLRLLGILVFGASVLFLAYIPYALFIFLQGGRKYEELIAKVVIVDMVYYGTLKLLFALYPITILPLYSFYERINMIFIRLGILSWIILASIDLFQTIRKNISK